MKRNIEAANEDAYQENKRFKESHPELFETDREQACSCGRKNCPGHRKPFGEYQLKEKIWDQVVDGAIKANPDADVSKGKSIFGMRRPFTGSGSIHPACAQELLGRPFRKNDFVNGEPRNARPWTEL